MNCHLLDIQNYQGNTKCYLICFCNERRLIIDFCVYKLICYFFMKLPTLYCEVEYAAMNVEKTEIETSSFTFLFWPTGFNFTKTDFSMFL